MSSMVYDQFQDLGGQYRITQEGAPGSDLLSALARLPALIHL